MSTDLLARADRLRAERTPFVLATVVRAERPTSAKAGDKAILLPDGTIDGFVGGVCAESTVRLEGLRLMQRHDGDSTLLRITPSLDDAVESTMEGLVVVGNDCLSGGTLDIFLEAMLPPTLVHVFGTAPIARALAGIATASGYEVVESTDPETPIAPGTSAVVVASHGRDEEKVLLTALRADIPYVGLVASRKRGQAVLDALDLTETERARVRTPAGLDIGARTALEVAVSVVAELISVRESLHSNAALHPRTARTPLPVVESTVVTAVDPVCGMSVAAVPASLHLEHAGTTYYFCGPGCRQAFADDPVRYLA
jgi:xanthine dehydrogenase accessory factor